MPGMVVGPEGYLPSKYRGHGVQARWIRWTRTMWTRRTRTRWTRTRRTRTWWTGKTWPGIKWTQTRWTSGDLSTVFCRFSHRCCGNYLLIFSPIFLPISLTMFSPFFSTHLPFFPTDCFAAFSTDFSTDYFANFCCLFANILPILVLIILLIFHK